VRALLTALPLAAGLAACAHGQIQLNTGAAASSTPGGVSSASGVNAQASGSTAAVLIGIGVAAAIASRDDMGYGTRYTANPFMAVTDSPRAPELAPGRRVNEQDCTKPIEDFSANLKCR